MTEQEFVSRIREHYLAQFKNYVELLADNYPEGRAEVKMKIEPEERARYAHAPPFEDWFCVDFVSKRGGDMALRVFSPKEELELAPMQTKRGEMLLALGNFRWDNAVIRFAPATIDQTALKQWFNKWFAPSTERKPAGTALSGNIHFVTLSDGALKIDFGAAPPDAFWDVLDVLKASGATHVTVARGDPIVSS